MCVPGIQAIVVIQPLESRRRKMCVPGIYVRRLVLEEIAMKFKFFHIWKQGAENCSQPGILKNLKNSLATVPLSNYILDMSEFANPILTRFQYI